MMRHSPGFRIVSTLSVKANRSVAGSIKTRGIAGTMGHIHLAEPGSNGPPIITLVKTAEGTWSVPGPAGRPP